MDLSETPLELCAVLGTIPGVQRKRQARNYSLCRRAALVDIITHAPSMDDMRMGLSCFVSNVQLAGIDRMIDKNKRA